MSTSPSPGNCAVCGETCAMKCSRCGGAHYCSREHQKIHWKAGHKAVCFPPNAVCTRCCETIVPGTTCRIPHPEHLQEQGGSSFGPDGCSYSFSCKACSGSYEKSSQNRDLERSSLPITRGPKWCFTGIHTIKPVKGDCRIRKDVVVLRVARPTISNIQEQIQALDNNMEVRILKICSEGYFVDKHKPKLAIRLPNLEKVLFEDVEMAQIHLTEELTPKVEEVWMQNPTQEEEPDFRIELPQLKKFSCFYWGPGDDGWVIRMLEKATKLEVFDSYKLRVGYLKFASNHLQSIRLHRAECLQELDLWAPRLIDLNVQAAYDLATINFLDDHPLKRELPTNFSFTQELRVNAMNALLGEEAIAELEAHPRVRQRIEQGSDDIW